MKSVTEFETKENGKENMEKENKFQGITTDKDLQTYPPVHLTSSHECDPSVLEYVYPEDNGEHKWINDPTKKFQFAPNIDEFDDYINKSLPITPQISSTHNLLVN